jgi:hypothetical protein
MKSQDIFLILKLVALDLRDKALHGEPLPLSAATVLATPEGIWQDWTDGAPETAIFPAHFLVEIPERGSDPYKLRALAEATGLSKSEVSNALVRLADSGLGKPRHGDTGFSVNYRGLEEFLLHGIRYVFPARTKEFTRGITTGLTAPVFNQNPLKAATDQPPVWRDPKGNTSGVAVEPLYRTVPMAVRQDNFLYELLALVDSIRMGLPREHTLASSMLSDLLNH